jgi:hypothetical protein
MIFMDTEDIGHASPPSEEEAASEKLSAAVSEHNEKL